MQKLIQQLCREYTDLSEEEIQVIEMMAQTLQPLANLEAADIFVDCPCKDKDAIVVAEAKPEEVPSAYRSSVVGMLAKRTGCGPDFSSGSCHKVHESKDTGK